MILPPKLKKLLQERTAQQAMTKKVSTPTTRILTPTPRSRTQAPKTMEEYMRYAMGPQQAFYTNANGGAGSMSMSPLAGSGGSGGLGTSDALVGNASNLLWDLKNKLAGPAFAEGGKVAVSANALKRIKEAAARLQSNDKELALQALRSSREAMSQKDTSAAVQDLLGQNKRSAADRLKKLIEADANKNKVPFLADGGEVPVPQDGGGMADADPQALYAEFQQLLAQLQSGSLNEQQEMEVINRLQEIENILEAMGIEVDQDQTGQPEQQGPDLQGMMSQLQSGAAGLGLGQ